MDEDRAISSVLGVVLILAVMTGAITAMMVVGTVALSQTQADTQLSQMETSMAEMSSKVSQVALGDSSSQSFDLGRQAIGNMHIDEEAGHVTVKVNGTTEYSDNLGVITYENGDSTVAFQGGGVWKSQNDNGGEMISPPEFHYQDATLTFPVIRATAGENSASSSGQIIERADYEEDSIFPNENYSNPLNDQNATVAITSEYHRGWYDFFSSRTTGDVEHYPDEERVVVDLVAPFSAEIISGLSIGSSDIDQSLSNSNDVDIEADQQLQDADPLVSSKIDSCEDQFDDYGGTNEFDESQYCFEGNISINDAVFHTENHDVHITIDGDLTIDQSNVTVDGENRVYFYQTGDLNFEADWDSSDGGTFNDQRSDEFVFVLNSTSQYVTIDNTAGYGVVYAPNSKLSLDGNADFYGALSTQDAEGPASVVIKQDEELDSFPIDLGETFDIINYLHITENIVEFVFD